MSYSKSTNLKKPLPFLKWAGGKRWLANSSELQIPTAFNNYIEPFLGGAALFFHINPESAILSDLNGDLIEVYEVIKNNHAELESLLLLHHEFHSKEYYYSARAKVPSSTVERAARFIYLNRTCWNGLYRVNLKGTFNVPIGTKTAVCMDTDNFPEIARLLKNVTIRVSDFESTIAMAGESDFVFVDPPYTVKHNNNNFIKYNETIFGWKDQERLHAALLGAKERGAFILVTNADHECIRSLYSDFGSYSQVSRHSVLAGKSNKRRPTTEALFTCNF